MAMSWSFPGLQLKPVTYIKTVVLVHLKLRLCCSSHLLDSKHFFHQVELFSIQFVNATIRNKQSPVGALVESICLLDKGREENLKFLD
jgi:hypothetical protein